MVTQDNLEPLAASTLREHIVAALTGAILSGKFPQGERLNESQISRQLRVSRAPIREALQQLQEQGLVVNQSRRGMFVVKLDGEDVQKVNRIRLILESEALRLAARHLTVAGEKKLTQLLDRMEAMGGVRAIKTISADLDFHRGIWSLSGNEYLERILFSLTAPLFAHAVLSMPKDEQVRMVLDSHRPLLEFVQGRRQETAEQIMFAHLRLRWGDPAESSSPQ